MRMTFPHGQPSLQRALAAVLLFFSMTILGANAVDQAPAVVGPDTDGPVHLAGHVRFLDNADGRWTADAVLAGQAPFGPVPETGAMLRPTRTRAWLAFPITNAFAEARTFEVHFEVGWDTVRFLMPVPGAPPRTALLVNTAREAPQGGSSFPMSVTITLPARSTTTCYAEVRSGNFLLDSPGKYFSVAPTVLQEARDLSNRFFQSFWVGCMLLAILYLVGSYLAFREPAYPAMVLFIVAITVYFLHLRSLLFWLVPPPE
jgi:hypothetical protein